MRIAFSSTSGFTRSSVPLAASVPKARHVDLTFPRWRARSGKGATGHLTPASSHPRKEDRNKSRRARQTYLYELRSAWSGATQANLRRATSRERQHHWPPVGDVSPRSRMLARSPVTPRAGAIRVAHQTHEPACFAGFCARSQLVFDSRQLHSVRENTNERSGHRRRARLTSARHRCRAKARSKPSRDAEHQPSLHGQDHRLQVKHAGISLPYGRQPLHR